MAVSPTYRYSSVLSFFNTVYKKPGQFSPTIDAAQQIKATLDAAKVQQSFQQYYAGIANQLEGIRQGVVKPTEDWELTAGFYQAQGTPFRVTVEDGKPKITAQADDEMTGRSVVQKRQLQAAIASLDGLFQQYDDQQTKFSLNYKLAEASDRLNQMQNFYSPPSANWEFEARRLYKSGTPMQIALDAKGNVTVLDQTKDLFTDRSVADRKKLQQAMSDWKQIQAGTKTATELWQFEALGNKSEGSDFYIDLDDAGKIDIKRNNYQNIVPDFLKIENIEDVKTTARWQNDALEMYKNGKGFYLDFLGTNIVVKENNYINISGLTDPTRFMNNNAQMTGLLNLLS